jgi:hydroxyacylglutathione hydrolase
MMMIFKRLIVGPIGTNCYIFGSENSREVVIIDPGGNERDILDEIERLKAKPSAILLTHGHFDHTLKVAKIKRIFKVPLMYNEQEYLSGVFTQQTADKWLKEGDEISLGAITLKVLETPGHSPGSICFYTDDVNYFENEQIDGILFSGDLIFRLSIGRSDIPGGDQALLFSSIKQKIMNNKNLTDKYLIFPGHMEHTSIGFERKNNMFRKYFT